MLHIESILIVAILSSTILGLRPAFNRTFVETPASRRLRRAQKQGLLGDSGFMTKKQERTLQKNEGLIVGQSMYNNHELRIPIEGHGFTFAPPRSGKFTCGISPNLKSGWKGPVISIGPKGEEFLTWAETRRKMGRKVALIDPFNSVSRQAGHRVYTIIANPFLSIRKGEDQVQDIGAIVDALITTGRAGSSAQDHFIEGARRFLSGLIAYVINSPSSENTLESVWNQLNQPKEDFDGLLDEMLASDAGFGLAQQAAGLFLSVDPKERGSFLSTLTNAISFLKYPQLRDNTNAESIASLLEKGDTDIFIVPPAEILSDVAAWVRLQIALIIHWVKLNRPKKRILMMIDELAALGNIKVIPETINLGAGYGISLWGFSQSILDLDRVYGRETARSMIAASQFTQFFNVSMADRESQRIVSDLLGDITVKVQNKSRSNGPQLLNDRSNFSQSETWQRQTLLSPAEIGQLPGEACLVLLQHPKLPRKPLLCRKREVLMTPKASTRP